VELLVEAAMPAAKRIARPLQSSCAEPTMPKFRAARDRMEALCGNASLHDKVFIGQVLAKWVDQRIDVETVATLIEKVVRAVDADAGEVQSLALETRDAAREAQEIVADLIPVLNRACAWYRQRGRPEFAGVYMIALMDVVRGPIGNPARVFDPPVPARGKGNPKNARRGALRAALRTLTACRRQKNGSVTAPSPLFTGQQAARFARVL
jgi:hypothetical protein